MKLHIKKYLFIYTIMIILFVVIVVGVTSRRNTEGIYETILAAKTDLTQEVEVTGKVHPTQERFLAFERSGKVASAQVFVGEDVIAGQLLVSLDTSELRAQLRQSEAAIVQE